MSGNRPRVDTVLRNGRVATPDGVTASGVGVAIDDGKVAAVAADRHLPAAAETVDLGGDVVAPGVVDGHVHTRTPGHEYKEDWETATRAAAAGGVTTVVAMPNTDPIIDRPERVRRVFATADRDALVDYQTHAVVTSENLDRIRDVDEVGVAGFKIFLGLTFGDIAAPDDGELYRAMQEVAETDRRLGFHEENDELRAHLEGRFRAAGKTDPIYHCRARPVLAEVEAVQRIMLFAEETDCPVHMFHLSSGSAAEAVLSRKRDGVDVTAETCPHYLRFTEREMERLGTVARVQPPLRTAEERDSLWAVGMEEGAVDCIATDHAPHTDEEKKVDDPFGNVWEVPGGFVGVETQVAAMLSFVAEGRLTLPEWVALHSTRPARIWGMYPEKGSLQVGTDADLVVVDPTAEWTLDRHDLHSKSTATPWDGEQFTGTVRRTYVRGEPVFAAGEVRARAGYGRRVAVGETRGGSESSVRQT